MNPSLASVPPSLIRAINARKRPGDIDLGLGEPTLRPDPAPFEAAVEWVEAHGCPYSPNAGFGELREAVARRYGAGRFAAAENVCVTAGSEEALYLAIKALVDPARDEVLIVEPCYLAYPKICLMEGIRHRMVPLSAEEEFRPRAAPVLDALAPDTRMLILNSPCNPTGQIWSSIELEALFTGLAARGGPPVYVLMDEVYRELRYSDPGPSLATLYPHTLLAGSLSKSNALTGLRLGWLIGPDNAVAAATKVHQFVTTAASTFSQRVAIEIFADPDALGAQREWYVDARSSLVALAREHRVSIIPPEGAFYCLVRLPPSLATDSVAAAERLLDEERVVTVPGRAFGASAEGWLRLSWAAPRDQLAEGLRRIGGFLTRNS